MRCKDKYFPRNHKGLREFFIRLSQYVKERFLLLHRDEFILLLRIHLVGGLDGGAGEGEQEAAGLEGLLVGGDDAGGGGFGGGVGGGRVDGEGGLAVLDEM